MVYEYKFLGCSRIYTGVSGQILTPNYPIEYPDNLACSWAVKVSPSYRIKLFFQDFQLEEAASCFDQLVIKDGTEGPSLGKNII